MEERIVLCAASCYTKKYYLNPEFEALPQAVKDELKIMCVLYTEDVSGTIQLVFDEDGSLQIIVDHSEEDLLYDEIGSALKVKQFQKYLNFINFTNAISFQKVWRQHSFIRLKRQMIM